ncbi:uncharacterized protein [Anabrus simplex]|uniref:uncharacterized protein n=1 Tax=Anabrus simplex TaxID=316456 RepID=UPI0035A3B721
MFEINVAYQSLLTSFLATPGYEHQIANEDDILNSGIPYGLLPNIREYFDRNDERDARIIDGCTIVRNVTTGIRRVVYKQDFVFLAGKLAMTYALSKWYHDENGDPLIVPFKDNIATHNVGIFLKKGHPFLTIISSLIERIVQGGLIPKWLKDILYITKLKSSKFIKFEANAKGQPYVMTVGHLQGAFIVLLVGLAISIFVILAEFIHRTLRTTPDITMKQKKIALGIRFNHRVRMRSVRK